MLHILLIDPEPVRADACREQLAGTGVPHRLAHVPDAEAALALLAGGPRPPRSAAPGRVAPRGPAPGAGPARSAAPGADLVLAALDPDDPAGRADLARLQQAAARRGGAALVILRPDAPPRAPDPAGFRDFRELLLTLARFRELRPDPITE